MLPEFKTLLDLIKRFPDEKSCHQYLAGQRWDGYMVCPHEECDNDRAYVFKDSIHYKCTCCRKKYTARTGTIFAESNISLIKWFTAIYLIMHKKGISSIQLSKDIGITQKSAWFLLQRIRTVLGNEVEEKMEGIIEIDESFVGGKNRNRHYDKKYKYTKKSRNYPDKAPVFGMLERGGKVRAMVVPTIGKKYLKPIIYQNIHMGSSIYSDAYQAYTDLRNDFHTGMVEHHRGNYANGYVYTNGIENFWSHMKRSIFGIYIQVSRKHLNKYVQESVFKFNTRHLGIQGQMNNFVKNMEIRLPYKELTKSA